MQHSIQFPKARKEKLIIKEIDNETLVYDLDIDQAHCLNGTAARVWQLCDGESSVSEIARALAGHVETEADETIVWLALDQLQKFNLLQEAPTAPVQFAGMSRRQWVRNVGLAAIALPAIVSIAAPAAQAQASTCVNPGGRAPGVPCGSNNQCCKNVCCSAPLPLGCPNNTCL